MRTTFACISCGRRVACQPICPKCSQRIDAEFDRIRRKFAEARQEIEADIARIEEKQKRDEEAKR